MNVGVISLVLIGATSEDIAVGAVRLLLFATPFNPGTEPVMQDTDMLPW